MTLFRRLALATVSGLFALSAGACGEADGHVAADHTAHSAHAAAPAPSAPSGHSVYHLGTLWRDRTGAERPLASLAGRIQVVAMVYTNCAYACPRLLVDMKRIEAELGARAEDVGFVIVSIDPERDTPARLAEFGDGARLDPARWTLLTGDDHAVRELAAVLGVQYRTAAPGEFVHSNLLTVLAPDGTPVHRQEGLGAEPTATLDVIRGILVDGA